MNKLNEDIDLSSFAEPSHRLLGNFQPNHSSITALMEACHGTSVVANQLCPKLVHNGSSVLPPANPVVRDYIDWFYNL